MLLSSIVVLYLDYIQCLLRTYLHITKIVLGRNWTYVSSAIIAAILSSNWPWILTAFYFLKNHHLQLSSLKDTTHYSVLYGKPNGFEYVDLIVTDHFKGRKWRGLQTYLALPRPGAMVAAPWMLSRLWHRKDLSICTVEADLLFWNNTFFAPLFL